MYSRDRVIRSSSVFAKNIILLLFAWMRGFARTKYDLGCGFDVLPLQTSCALQVLPEFSSCYTFLVLKLGF